MRWGERSVSDIRVALKPLTYISVGLCEAIDCNSFTKARPRPHRRRVSPRAGRTLKFCLFHSPIQCRHVASCGTNSRSFSQFRPVHGRQLMKIEPGGSWREEWAEDENAFSSNKGTRRAVARHACGCSHVARSTRDPCSLVQWYTMNVGTLYLSRLRDACSPRKAAVLRETTR